MPRTKKNEQPVQEQPAQASSVEPIINDLANKTAADLLKEHFDIDDYVSRETKRLKEFLQPFVDRDEAIKVRLQAKLNELGGEKGRSIKTEFGTFFNTTITTPKIVDKEKYLDCVLDNYDTFGNGMLQLRAPNKESIEQYMKDNNGALPPGIESSSYVNLNIRRA